MKFEIRYTTLKHTDIDMYLSEEQKEQLDSICQTVDEGRNKGGKESFMALIIEQDWPEFGPALRMLAKRVDLEDQRKNQELSRENSKHRKYAR